MDTKGQLYICFYHAVGIDGFRLQVATSLLLLVSVKVSQPLQCCLDLYCMCSPPSGQSGTWVLIYLQFEILFRVRSMLVRATSMHVQFGDKPRSSKTSFLSSFLLSISIILFLSLSSHFQSSYQSQARGQQREEKTNNESLSHPLGTGATLIGEYDRLNHGPPTVQVLVPGVHMWRVSVELW